MIFLGIDLGASALKLSAVQQDGKWLGTARQPVASQHPHAGQVEQSPQGWVAALQNALAQLWQDSPLTPEDITAISITAGTHIGVLCDADCQPLRPAIMWSDQRAHEEVADLCQHQEAIIAASLHRPNPTWTLAHLRWLWVHEPDILRATRHLLPAKDWLRHQLTGDIHTDLGDAVGTQLYDIAQKNWSPPLCALAGITPDILPPIAASSKQGGTVTAQAAQAFGLKAGTPIYIGCMDTSAELLGIGAVGAGRAALKLASAGVVSVGCDAPHAMPPISCYPHADTAAGWYFASGMNSCTSALDWFRTNRLDDMPLDKMTALAEQSALGAGGILFHPFINGERAPYWSPHLRPSLSGLSQDTAQADLARAAFEGIGYALIDVRQDMQQRTQCAIHEFTLLGGGAGNPFWAQMICDMQGVPIQIPRHRDAAYGAALQAGLAHGAYLNLDVLTKMIEMVTTLSPNMDNHALYHARFETYRALCADMLGEKN